MHYSLEKCCIHLKKFYFTCECVSGWIGQNRSEEINDCDTGPCMHGALCQEPFIPPNLYICATLLCWSICHHHHNHWDLLNEPCTNNSICLMMANRNHNCICEKSKSSCLFYCLFIYSMSLCNDVFLWVRKTLYTLENGGMPASRSANKKHIKDLDQREHWERE